MARISDPKAMRALAHPLRIQLLELVVARGRATATELAEAVGESPANCSFHLRKLAEFGYLERADDATGREKPWRVTDPTQDFVTDPDDPESRQANTAVASAFREWDVARMQAAEGRPNPPAWRGATFQHGATMIVTPDEAKAIGRALTDLLAPYHDRLTDPSLRPDGAGADRLFAATTYLPEYQELLDSPATGMDTAPGDTPAGGETGATDAPRRSPSRGNRQAKA
jgi:DNA-binding transcriptional ArsR family regulator